MVAPDAAIDEEEEADEGPEPDGEEEDVANGEEVGEEEAEERG